MRQVSKLSWLLAPVILAGSVGCSTQSRWAGPTPSPAGQSVAEDRTSRMLEIAEQMERDGKPELAHRIYGHLLAQEPGNAATRERMELLAGKHSGLQSRSLVESIRERHVFSGSEMLASSEQARQPAGKQQKGAPATSMTAATILSAQMPKPVAAARPTDPVFQRPAPGAPASIADAAEPSQVAGGGQSREDAAISTAQAASPAPRSSEKRHPWVRAGLAEAVRPAGRGEPAAAALPGEELPLVRSAPPMRPEASQQRSALQQQAKAQDSADEEWWSMVFSPGSAPEEEGLTQETAEGWDSGHPLAPAGPTTAAAAEPSRPATDVEERTWKPTSLARLCPNLTHELRPLVKQLDSRSPAERSEALISLSRLGERAAPALLALRAMLDDPEPRVRVHAAGALREIHGDAWDSVYTLGGVLEAEDPEVVCLASYLLGQIGPEAMDAVPQLEELRDSTGGLTRLHAAEALIRIAPDDLASLEVLKSALSDDDAQIRWFAAVSLGTVRDGREADAAEALKVALGDSDPNVRIAAALSLGGLRTGAAVAIEDLEQLALFDSPEVRDAAATALACLRR